MSKKAELRGHIGLDVSQFVGGLRSATKSLAKFNRQGGQRVTAALEKGFRRVRLAALAAGAAVAAIGYKATKAAGEVERFRTQFETLLGNKGAAKQRVDQLLKFSANTPFRLSQITEASAILQNFTKGALATGEGLKLVGDAAAGVQTDIGELSLWVGRLYSNLQSGRPIGKAMMRLQQLAVISGETRAEIESLALKSGDEAWAAAERALMKFSGAMKLQSGTWEGTLSTLADNIDIVFAKLGAPVIDAAIPALNKFIEIAQNDLAPAAEKFGERLAVGIGRAAELLDAVTNTAKRENLLKRVGNQFQQAFVDTQLNIINKARSAVNAISLDGGGDRLFESPYFSHLERESERLDNEFGSLAGKAAELAHSFDDVKRRHRASLTHGPPSSLKSPGGSRGTSNPGGSDTTRSGGSSPTTVNGRRMLERSDGSIDSRRDAFGNYGAAGGAGPGFLGSVALPIIGLAMGKELRKKAKEDEAFHRRMGRRVGGPIFPDSPFKESNVQGATGGLSTPGVEGPQMFRRMSRAEKIREARANAAAASEPAREQTLGEIARDVAAIRQKEESDPPGF